MDRPMVIFGDTASTLTNATLIDLRLRPLVLACKNATMGRRRLTVTTQILVEAIGETAPGWHSNLTYCHLVLLMVAMFLLFARRTRTTDAQQ